MFAFKSLGPLRSVSARVISAVINSATLRRVAIHKKDNKSTCSPKRSHWVLLLFLFFLFYFSHFFFAMVKYRTQESRGWGDKSLWSVQ